MRAVLCNQCATLLLLLYNYYPYTYTHTHTQTRTQRKTLKIRNYSLSSSETMTTTEQKNKIEWTHARLYMYCSIRSIYPSGVFAPFCRSFVRYRKNFLRSTYTWTHTVSHQFLCITIKTDLLYIEINRLSYNNAPYGFAVPDFLFVSFASVPLSPPLSVFTEDSILLFCTGHST